MTTIAKTRGRINAKQQHDRPRQSQASSTVKQQRMLYACIPAKICGDPRSHDLSPLEVAVMGTLISLARIANAAQQYKKAFKAGKRSIELEGALHQEFKADWRAVKQARKAGHTVEAPQRYHAHALKGRYKPIRIKQAMRDAGTIGFRRTMEALRSEPLPDEITFSITRSALVRHVGLSKCIDNLNAIDDALMTLADLIRLGNRIRQPLVTVDRRSRALTITVSGIWANMQYHRVPLPLPTKSPLATHLLLWTHFVGGVKDESVTKKDSDYKAFVQKFGYGSQWRANEAVNRAIDFLNRQYFRKLDKKALREFGIKAPDALLIVAEEDRFKIVSVTDGTYNFDKAMQSVPKRKIKRERMSDDDENAPDKAEQWRLFENRLASGWYQ